ncbi:uncharacterized protein NECHADRAFT_39412 [Fusarium vanettenii 77-13-4]|uniref:Uncharacterized protein n=1 Tax=Fusarium vanettenii (strain ATCC MYA-4622 / CBS 123669 / FGSC 9596 / NRRL 45880 / 77-13-4) TaxID=660122 RepID=C7Z8D4_FUSV7|nr:uncharacterized protein NECHADRAFT_39412 [Fusarium vanettenii 77-13-4]EEU39850.1 hypothetical protein NECHADRAFT_39412 [Fusarium vanettenii 77-13-4]
MGTRRQLSWRAAFALIPFFSLSLLLLSYVGFPHSSHLNPRASATDHHDAVDNLTKRATDLYEPAREKGAKLHCLMGMSKADAKAANGGASLESPIYLQTDLLPETEGWKYADSKVYFASYLNEALAALNIPREFHHHTWKHLESTEIYDDPTWFVDDNAEPNFNSQPGQASLASFANSFILDPGVIIADKNLGVAEAMKQNLINPNSLTTHIKKWSDMAWIQWFNTCKFQEGDVTTLKYIIRSWITNHTTLSLIFEAILNKNDKDGKGTRIGRWNERITLTVDDNPDEFHAILGSPNGAGSAYLLINHKDKLGVRVINKVDIFVPNIGFDVEGTTVDKDLEARKVMLLFHITKV